jgi:uracil-DNA glycosylase family 4
VRNLFGQPIIGRRVLGCSSCPLDKAPGIRKIKGLSRIRGRKVMVWGQSPGGKENEQELELVGPYGDFTWKALSKVGINREDCDIQNVLRCRPTDHNGKDREPDKKELLCCSVYTEEALDRNRGNAVVHLVMGDVAGSQLFGKDFKKDHPVFWHQPWNAYVVLVPHPATLLRRGGSRFDWNYDEWIDRLHAVRAVLDHHGRWGYAKAQNHKIVVDHADAEQMERQIRDAAQNGQRVSIDIEDGIVNGRRVILLVGFGIGSYAGDAWDSWDGACFSVVVDHPSIHRNRTQREDVIAVLKRIIEDPTIRKSLQHGSYDDHQLQRMLGIAIQGYDYDTQYATYLRYSFLRSVSLETQTSRFLPEFCDYKESTAGYEKNFADCPLDLLALRNCCDCDVTKRMEAKIPAPGAVNYELLQVYIHAAYTLDAMKRRGPILDRPTWQNACDETGQKQPDGKFTGLVGQIDREIRQAVGNPNLNPGSPPQLAELLYDTMGLLPTKYGRSTGYEALQELIQATGGSNPLLKRIEDRRMVAKMASDLKAYGISADMHNEQLRTIWHLTGAVTGRLRSGQGKDGDASGIINFQNLTPTLSNCLVSDLNWRKAMGE